MALAALCVAAYCAHALARAAAERRDDLVRLVVAERKAALATSPHDLAIPGSSGAAQPMPGLEDEEDGAVGTVGGGLKVKDLRVMAAADMNPSDPEDVMLYRLMTSEGLDPSNQEDVAFWNEKH